MIRYCDAYWNDADSALACIPNLDRMRGRSVWITGGTGMICSSVVDLLLRYNHRENAGIRIVLAGRSKARVCARFAGFAEGRDFFFMSYDATLPAAAVQTENVSDDPERGGTEQILEIDYIIHGASNADPAVLTREPVETILANVVGLNSLLSAAAEGGAQRLLYVSSSEVYGTRVYQKEPSDAREGLPSPEDGQADCPFREEDYGFVDILNPRASYPCSKRTAETLCISYGQEYGLDTVIVRPGHIYGPSITATDSRASAQFTRNAAQGEDIVMKSAGTQLRSYCYTLDCASAMLTVLLNGETGNAYNISNRDSIVTISDVAHALANAAGTKVICENATELERKGYNLMSNSSLDAEKLEQLGWHALFGLAEGAEKTLAFYECGRGSSRCEEKG